MQVTTYSKFRARLKSYMDDCVSRNEPIIINRNEDDSVVLVPLKKFNGMDETEFLKLNSDYAVHVLKIFKRMKLKSQKILDPASFKKLK